MAYQGISVFTGKPVEVEVQGTFIQSVTPLKTRGHLPYISPGFLDMQVNGYMGNDYSLEDFSEDQIAKIIFHLNRSGTTQHLSTIITSPRGADSQQPENHHSGHSRLRRYCAGHCGDPPGRAFHFSKRWSPGSAQCRLCPSA